MKKLPLVLAICSAACLPQNYAFVGHAYASIENGSAKEEKTEKSAQAGNYLAARFAQQHHDWKNAHRFIDSIMQSGIELEEIQKRAMILAMGAGEAKAAIQTAEKMIASNDKNMSVAYLFLIADAFKNEDYNKAKDILQKTPVDTTSLVMSPYINAWLGAAEGRLDVASLKDNTVQLYHGILISDFLGNHAEITGILEKSLKVEDINPHEIVRIADLYAHIGAKDKAIALYEKALKDAPDNEEIQVKISAVKNGTDQPLFEKIASPKTGIAKAFHDIAVTLYHDYNDESACIFANIALYINPDMVETKLLLANISGRHNQGQEAIAFYKSVPEDHKEYLAAHRKISDILAESGKTEEALAILQNLATKKKDVESQIKIGDIYRSSENFGLALEAYNKAAKMLGGKVPQEYWHLHYVRGMVYEQIGSWADAEKELKDALVLQPDHPYILNYLGYAWADRGINLEESLKMIARAVELRPSDGYIMDSLGWVKYRMGDFRGAAPVLEKAVALLPYDPTINDHLGDAYWRVGRKLEARFQWERAKNHSDEAEAESIKAIEQKIVSGLEEKPAILGAKK